MDDNLQFVVEKRIERTAKSLKDNGFDVHFIKSRQEMFKKLEQYLKKEETSCSVGGSMTLFETGIKEFLEEGGYEYYDRYAPGIDQNAVYLKALTCDVYLTSANAITEDGEIYSVDGRGNRLAALSFGPKKVIIIAGYNKIVKNIEEARQRVRQIAAPANAVRLNRQTPCTKTGVCADCSSSERICNIELVIKRQAIKDRITVLLLPGLYGY